MSDNELIVPDDIPDDWEPEGDTEPGDESIPLDGNDHTLIPAEELEEVNDA